MRCLTWPQVEELIRMKPLQAARAPAGASTGISFLDRFTTKMESLATDLERSVDRMQQKLNDTVQVSLMAGRVE